MDIMYLASRFPSHVRYPALSKLTLGLAVPIGLGRHMIMLSLPAIESFTKVASCSQVKYHRSQPYLVIFFCPTSICCLYNVDKAIATILLPPYFSRQEICDHINYHRLYNDRVVHQLGICGNLQLPASCLLLGQDNQGRVLHQREQLGLRHYSYQHCHRFCRSIATDSMAIEASIANV